jgi:hypothetical protein
MKQMLKNNKKTTGLRNKMLPRPYENETVKILEVITGEYKNRKPVTPALQLNAP